MTTSFHSAIIGKTIGACALVSVAFLPVAAFAQSAADATMPVLYNQQGAQVNAGTSPLPAGTYYLQTGGQMPVQYFGNGMYYNAATDLYGGSVPNDPNGTAGVDLGYRATAIPGTAAASVPNTGVGGGAYAVWMTLVLSGAIALGGMAYLVSALGKERRMGA